MNTIEKALEKLDSATLGTPQAIALALTESLGDNGVSVGTTVAVIGDPTYPFDGCKGKVKALNKGFANVEFDGGVRADLLVSLLLPVSA